MNIYDILLNSQLESFDYHGTIMYVNLLKSKIKGFQENTEFNIKVTNLIDKLVKLNAPHKTPEKFPGIERCNDKRKSVYGELKDLLRTFTPEDISKINS